MHLAKQRGFSLIELLVVVAIVGLLAAAGIVGYKKYINSAKDATATSNFKQIIDALQAEDVQLNNCKASDDSAQDIIDCVQSISRSADMSDVYANNSPLVVLMDSLNIDPSYQLKLVYENLVPQWPATGIFLVICNNATDSNGNSFVIDNEKTSDLSKNEFALFLKTSDGASQLRKITLQNLKLGPYGSNGPCGG